MDLKEPKRKPYNRVSKKQPFPVFIESGMGIPSHNWFPNVCTGSFNGFSVVVDDPGDMSTLYDAGYFGKGFMSRSVPVSIIKKSASPAILRKRQFDRRVIWEKRFSRKIKAPGAKCDVEKEAFNKSVSELEAQILNLDKEIREEENENVVLLSSDDDMETQSVASSPSSQNNCFLDDSTEKMSYNKDISSNGFCNFPKSSVVVIPDSDPEQEDYFESLKPKLYLDRTKLKEILSLSLQEAYFLAYALGCLQILDTAGKPLTLEESWELFMKTQKDFLSKYVVYHYYRAKGYIVKPGIKYGGDFLLYKDGPPFYHAHYIIVIKSPQWSTLSNDWPSVLGHIRMSTTTVKEILLTEVIYPTEKEIMEQIKVSPEHIQRFKVNEILLRRGLPIDNQENAEFHND